MNPENPVELARYAPDDLPRLPPDTSIDVPYHTDVLPDGRDSVIIGDVETLKDYCHQQGDNPLGFQQTCGLCACAGVLRQFGIEKSEADVVPHAKDYGLCTVIEGSPEKSGGTTILELARILSDFGLPAHGAARGSLEGLAASLQQGRGVIVGLNAGVFWDDSRYLNQGHALTPIAVARDPETWEIQGFYVNDTGKGECARFVDAAIMDDAWVQSAGGQWVVTDRVRQGNKLRTA
jgi:hypothetical protein